MENIVRKITQPKWRKTKNKVIKICDEPGIWHSYSLLICPWFWEIEFEFLSILNLSFAGYIGSKIQFYKLDCSKIQCWVTSDYVIDEWYLFKKLGSFFDQTLTNYWRFFAGACIYVERWTFWKQVFDTVVMVITRNKGWSRPNIIVTFSCVWNVFACNGVFWYWRCGRYFV